MRVLYFAWLREKTGVGQEELSPPPEANTPRALAAWLAGRGPGHAAAFANMALIRCAADQEFVDLDATLGDAAEVAFFPPVTGG
jgi:molybdopterin converting factor subunit 1